MKILETQCVSLSLTDAMAVPLLVSRLQVQQWVLWEHLEDALALSRTGVLAAGVMLCWLSWQGHSSQMCRRQQLLCKMLQLTLTYETPLWSPR